MRFLDDVIEVNNYPLPQIDELARGNRKIGLGVMGWADMLIKMDIAYDSDEAVALGEKVMGIIQAEAKAASRKLAEERGNFPNFEGSIYDTPEGGPMRNATVTTIAPTGTLSIIANCSSGVEPLFAVSYVRTVMDNDRLVEVNPIFEEVAVKRGFYSRELMQLIAEHGSVHDIDEVPEDVQQRLRDRARHLADRAHPDAGGVPEAHRQRRLQDGQLRQRAPPPRTCARSTTSPTSSASRASRSTATAARSGQVLTTGKTAGQGTVDRGGAGRPGRASSRARVRR